MDRTLELLRRVLALEQRQGYRNTSATGGLYRYFQEQFARHQYDEATWSGVESLLHGLKRYEAMGTVAERHAQTEILLRRAAELATTVPGAGTADGHTANSPAPPAQKDNGRRPDVPPVGPVSPAHRGTAPDLARVRGNGQVVAVSRQPSAISPAVEEPDAPQPPSSGTGSATPPASTRLQSASSAMPPQAQADQGSPTSARGTKATSPLTTNHSPLATHLDQPLREVLKIRPQEMEKLERLGVRTVGDALFYVPRDHYDCRNPTPINRLKAGMTTVLVGTLQAVDVRRTARKLSIVEARVKDETGIIRLAWLNQQHMAALLRPHVGQPIAVSGHTELYNGRLQFAPRDYEFPDEGELTHTSGLVPVYPLTEGLTQRWMRGAMKRALAAGLHLLEDPLPAALRARHRLEPLASAVGDYHFPDDEAAKAAAVRRLAFDELLYMGIGMARRKRAWQHGDPARPVPRVPDVLDDFKATLPFALTGAQRRALGIILDDMARPVPMNRLLQGDVGSGKTVVAAAALLMTARAGMQGAIMAPTEILAEQHARSIGRLLQPFDIRVELLTGSVKGAARRAIYQGAADGTIDVLVGTHALIQEGVTMERLGLAVVDEQHRFGVEQRGALRQKGFQPHVLAMTATPIPRTLALTIYGDVDVATIDERPPGRQPVETSWEPSEKAAFALVREQVAEGRQAFVICPLVEETDKSDARAAVAEHRRLQKEVFPDLRVGLLHGKMKPAEKEARLAEFRDGKIDVLVATSVVEVGIDVPNATVMVVEEANRFGLAQLHQFRGRVGRGAARSYCVLLAESASSVGQERLNAITGTDDGFKLAEIDLELRGAGDVLGTRQSGLPELKVAGLGDVRTIEEARHAAESIIAADPNLELSEHSLLARRVEQFWLRAADPS